MSYIYIAFVQMFSRLSKSKLSLLVTRKQSQTSLTPRSLLQIATTKAK